MNFTQAKHLVSNHLHTLLYLLGNVMIVVAVSLLISYKVGLLLTGISFITISLIISREAERR